MATIITTKIATEANVITHGGIFHADEVLATVMLSKIIDNLTVLRTFKVPEDISDEVIIYDIGGGKFDHHQKGGNGVRENGVPYAAAGLIWKEFGSQILANSCNPEVVWKMLDRDLVQGVDAIDNGTLPKLDYEAKPMNFSAIISSFNPTWDSSESPDDCFLKAVAFAETVFDNILKNAESKAKAQEIIDAAIESSEGHIMVLDRFVPWQEFLFSSVNEKAEEIQFAVFPSLRGGYNWQCVPDSLGGFGQRKPVPAEWKGLNGAALQEVTGIATAIFCHPAGFIGSAETLEDAIKLAELAINS